MKITKIALSSMILFGTLSSIYADDITNTSSKSTSKLVDKSGVLFALGIGGGPLSYTDSISGKGSGVAGYLGLKLGYQNMFGTSGFGLRGYFHSGFYPGATTKNVASLPGLYEATLNVDALYTFPNDDLKFGLYAGIGMGVGFNLFGAVLNSAPDVNIPYTGFVMPVNLGFSVGGYKNRFEFGMIIPTIKVKSDLGKIIGQDAASIINSVTDDSGQLIKVPLGNGYFNPIVFTISWQHTF